MQNYNHIALNVNRQKHNRLSTLFPKNSQNSPQLAIQELFPKTTVKLKSEFKEAIKNAKENGDDGVLICGTYQSISRTVCYGVSLE
ncbi:hypothetical protein [Emticicia sp. 21SJ11W-3]|uniref:hypothetical protein n=1 Tax=Emticicia sp. 21SJ11W-3 TaxID=2916755 RepID=UPI0020A0F4A1|nr:hypothetical protein [Emticicia sp. 21SJ11W-3]UTA68403.1 hypothetical protein MB380_01025 [Emticicia sp. 21SJ11W-3]